MTGGIDIEGVLHARRAHSATLAPSDIPIRISSVAGAPR
jgi:hypothetical protein